MISGVRVAVALSLFALLGACTPGARALTWNVEFEDPSLESRAVLFEGVITMGDCTERRASPAIYREEFPRSGTPPSPSILTPGTYAFSVRARDAECEWYAGGCTSETLPEAVDHETLVVLFAIPEEAVCPMQCAAGVCVAPDATVPDTSLLDTGLSDSTLDSARDDTGPADTSPPDTAPADTAPPDTFVPECSRDSDCGAITYARVGSWSCRSDGALDRAPFDFTIPECNSGRCGSRVERYTLECRCRDDICDSGGCADVVDSSTRCDMGGVEGECPNPAAEGECHR
jgi:hypothetical protein